MEYPGKELELFEHAKNWKGYFASKLIPYIKGNVAEVGAGIGGTTNFLFNAKVESWTCFEPDSNLFDQLSRASQSMGFQDQMELNNKILPEGTNLYDTILYIDVLEHIEQDQEELEKAIKALRPAGNLIVLVPAFNFLYSPFDKSIGHFRRYDKRMLMSIFPANASINSLFYLDTMGFLSSLLNKLVLRQLYPKPSQIRFWDCFLIPISKIIDKVFFHSFGKSLILIYKKL